MNFDKAKKINSSLDEWKKNHFSVEDSYTKIENKYPLTMPKSKEHAIIRLCVGFTTVDYYAIEELNKLLNNMWMEFNITINEKGYILIEIS